MHFELNYVKLVAVLASLAAIAAPMAQATLAVTNGNFESGAGFKADVIGWFDGTHGPVMEEWNDVFQDTNPVAPQAGTTVVWSGVVNATNFLYQPIGTKGSADGTMDVSIVVGDNASGPFTIGIYQSASFVGADGTDVAGAPGVTLIDSLTHTISYATGVVGTETATLSLATANLTGTIFLRFHYGVDGGGANGYLKGDLVTLAVQSGGDPYAAWAGTKELTVDNNGRDADPDNDGRSNLMEFALDGEPLSGANDGKVVGRVATLADTSKVLTLTLPLRSGTDFSTSGPGALVSAPVDGMVYHIQGSADLADFTTLAVTEVTGDDAAAIQAGMPNTLASGWTYRTFRTPGSVAAGNPRGFLRCAVAGAP